MKRLCLLIVLVWTGASQGVLAQRSQAKALVGQHRYSEAIDLLRQDGASLDALPDEVLFVLGAAHLWRARLLQDLAALQVDIGKDYYYERDTPIQTTRPKLRTR